MITVSRATRPVATSLPHRQWLALLVFFAIGFDYRLSAGAGPSVAILELVAYLASAVWFLDLVAAQRPVLAATLDAGRLLFWIVAYFAWAWLTVWLGFTRSADNLWAFRNLLPSLIISFVVITQVHDRQGIRQCLLAYLFGVSVNLCLAACQKVLGYPYPNALHAGALIKMDLEGQFITNTPAGFFVHPNGLAVYLIPAVVILLYGRRIDLLTSWSTSPVRWLLAAATCAVLYLTYAKGALAWAALGLGICLAPRWAKKRFGLLVAAILALIPLIVFIGTDPFHWGLRTLNSMATRYDIWKAAFRVFLTDPYVLAFGNGFAAIFWQTVQLSELPYLNAHNNVLNQVIFFGLPALALYLIAFASAIKKSARTIRATGQSDLLVCVAAATVALVAEHFFEPVLDSVALQAQYYAFLTLTLASAHLTDRQAEPT